MSSVKVGDATPSFVRDFDKFSTIEQQAVTLSSEENLNVQHIKNSLLPLIRDDETPKEIKELARYLVNNISTANNISRESRKRFIKGYYKKLEKAIDYLKQVLEEDFWNIKDENPEIDTESLMLIYDTVNRSLKHYEMALDSWKKAPRKQTEYIREIGNASDVLENCALKLFLLMEDGKLSEDAVIDLRSALKSLQNESSLSPRTKDYQKLDYSLV